MASGKWRFVSTILILSLIAMGSLFILHEGDHLDSGFKPVQQERGRREYQEGQMNCSTRILHEERELEEYLKEEKSKRSQCTFRYFNRHLKTTGSLVGGGVWYAPPDGLPSSEAEFYPSGCRFTNHSRCSKTLVQCLIRKNISRILVSGDSNGRKIAQNIRHLPEEATGEKCLRTAAENVNNSRKYFLVPSIRRAQVKTHHCGFAGGCPSWIYKCPIERWSVTKVKRSIRIEYLVMLHFNDASLHVAGNHTGDFKNWLLHAESRVEYVLKYYLPYHGFPDLWIYTPPLHHESWVSSLAAMKMAVAYTLSLLDVLVPRSTSMIFLADASECTEKRPNQVGLRFAEAWNTNRNKRLGEMNQLLFELLADRLHPSKNWHVFLDAVRITCPLVCSWHSDGAHMVPIWYRMMSEYVLATFCNEELARQNEAYFHRTRDGF